jgi:hypothetical protein
MGGMAAGCCGASHEGQGGGEPGAKKHSVDESSNVHWILLFIIDLSPKNTLPIVSLRREKINSRMRGLGSRGRGVTLNQIVCRYGLQKDKEEKN